MNEPTDLEQFVRAIFPRHSTLTSAVLEHSAMVRSIRFKRLSRHLTLLALNSYSVPFHEMNGPDTGAAALRVGLHHDFRRQLLQAQGIPVPRGELFTSSQHHAAGQFATQLGTRVRVRSSLHAENKKHDPGEGPFEPQWAKVSKRTKILVEEMILGTRLRVFVVDDLPVAATAFDESSQGHRFFRTHPQDAGALTDITDEASANVTGIAIKAAKAVPGFPYGAIDLVMPEHDTSAGPIEQPVVVAMNHSAAPVAHFPTHGTPRDVAGAIIDYYTGDNTRWEHARNTPHVATGSGRGAAVEPFFIGDDTR